MTRAGNLHLRSFWQFQIAGWVCFYLVDVLGSIPDLLSRHYSFAGETIPIVLMFLGSCGLRPICRWLMQNSPSWTIYELQAAAAAVVTGGLSACTTGIVMQGIHHVDWFGQIPISMWASYVLFMWCSLFFSIKQWQQSNKEKERLLRAENEVREARLLALRYQLNPHFLFNSLNAVSTLILDGKSPAATRMLAQIGDLLRASLESEVTAEVALSREMEFTDLYLAIEQTRLGNRLTLNTSIPLETRDALVPSMLLQPLVENAVRYGVATLVEGGSISIETAVHAGRLRIVIRNSGRREDAEHPRNGNGIGLGNTAERLSTLYGADHHFSLERPVDGGCKVTVELPFRKALSRPETISCAP